MLETHSPLAAEDNWLNDCLTSSLLLRLEIFDGGNIPPDFPHDVQPEYRGIIDSYPGLVERFNLLSGELAELSNMEREIVRSAIITQNQIPEIFDGSSPCITCINELPEIHASARRLFEFSFRTLSRIKSPGSLSSVRDNQFSIARQHLKKKCCPFCGLERLEPYHPDIPRHPLDHYLAVSRYPFCGVNLKNLPPIGERCNSSYKLALDIIHDEEGNRLACLDPYGDVTLGFYVENLELFDGFGGKPEWTLVVHPDTPEAANWDRIFRIRTRLEESLKADFDEWLTEMGGFLKKIDCGVDTIESLKKGLIRYRAACGLETLPSIGLLKSGVASMLLRNLGTESVQQRTHTFLKDAFSLYDGHDDEHQQVT